MNKRIKLSIGRDTPGDRVRAWERMIDENFFGIECRNADADLRTSLDSRRFENGVVTHMRYSPQTFVRRPDMIKNMDEERVIVAAFRSGNHRWLQGRDDLEVPEGSVMIGDVSRPYESIHNSDAESFAIQVPKASLVRRLGPIDTHVLGPHLPLQKLMVKFLYGLHGCIDQVDAGTANRLIEQALDLTALIFANFHGRRIDPSTHRAGTVLRLKGYIRAHLHDEDLNVEQAARAVGISSRYVHTLLAREGTSFGRYLLAERLERARRDIVDPRHIHRQVAEVAFDWGFKHPSHFSRAFKDRYGMSPRDAKHMR